MTKRYQLTLFLPLDIPGILRRKPTFLLEDISVGLKVVNNLVGYILPKGAVCFIIACKLYDSWLPLLYLKKKNQFDISLAYLFLFSRRGIFSGCFAGS